MGRMEHSSTATITPSNLHTPTKHSAPAAPSQSGDLLPGHGQMWNLINTEMGERLAFTQGLVHALAFYADRQLQEDPASQTIASSISTSNNHSLPLRSQSSLASYPHYSASISTVVMSSSTFSCKIANGAKRAVMTLSRPDVDSLEPEE